jgi:3-deoxy-D-manno-octulosonic-acid transferase
MALYLPEKDRPDPGLSFADYVYNFGALAYLFGICPLLGARPVRGHQFRWVLTRRMGLERIDLPAFDRPPVWLHAISVGEVAAAATVIDRLCARRPGRPVVLSVGTEDGLDEARRRFSHRPRVSVIVAPVDMPWAMRRLIDLVRPGAFVLVETDVWPNLLLGLRRCGVPAILINGRLSPGGGRTWRRFGRFAARVWGVFEYCLMQSAPDAARVRALGLPGHKVLEAGNLKYDLDRPAEAEVARLRGELGLDPAAPVLVAGSTHRGEERIVLEAFGRLLENSPRSRLIVAPRQPERFDEAALVIERSGFDLSRRSTGVMNPGAPVILLDTLGELAAVYGLARVAFVGGSLVAEHGLGGHNPLEAAVWGVPVLFGPNMKKFPGIRRELLEAGAGIELESAANLTPTLERLWSRPGEVETRGRAAAALVQRHRGSIETTMSRLLALLPDSE